LIIPDFLNNTFTGRVLPASLPFYGAIYALVDIKVKDKLRIIPGIRYDFWNMDNHHGTYIPEFWNHKDIDSKTRVSGDPSVRLNFNYYINPQHTIKGAIGNYSQIPAQPFITRNEKFGNPNLTTTKAAHYVLGYEWRLSDHLFADVQIYYNNH
jgi:outer membrane receptor protein involved in Fe transport